MMFQSLIKKVLELVAKIRGTPTILGPNCTILMQSGCQRKMEEFRFAKKIVVACQSCLLENQMPYCRNKCKTIQLL